MKYDTSTKQLAAVTAKDLVKEGKKVSLFLCHVHDDYPSHRTAPADNPNISTQQEAEETLREVWDYFSNLSGILRHRVILIAHLGLMEEEYDELGANVHCAFMAHDCSADVDSVREISFWDYH